jgi:hypothetical protein
MIEPEIAFADLSDNAALAEALGSTVDHWVQIGRGTALASSINRSDMRTTDMVTRSLC